MRKILLVVTIFSSLFFSYLVKSQSFTKGVWKIKSSAVIYNGDTTFLFKRNDTTSSFDLSKISYSFKENYTYNGTSIDNSPISGKWSLQLGQLALDSNSSSFQLLNGKEFVITNTFDLPDTLGNFYDARSVIYFEKDITELEILVFPNPFFNTINISIQDVKKNNVSISLADMFGRTLFEIENREFYNSGIFEINTSHISKGVYLLSIISKEFQKTFTIVK